MLTKEQIWSLARSVHPFAVEARRHLHRYPELSYEETETQLYIAGHLTKLGIPFEKVASTGIKAIIEGGKPGPTIALRADIDALPMTEETGLGFASEIPGKMHACGHDAHTATLLGAAKALQQIAPELAGRVVLVFQPGEEKNPGGALLMIRDGVLENPRIDAIFGVHVLPDLEVGKMGFGAGARMAAPDEFDCTIIGKGGHGARPHGTVDPIMTAAQCITLLQQIVARNINPFQSAVITIGQIQGGTARNVIPDEVTFKGTVRTMDPDVQTLMPQRIEAVIKGVCEAAGATYKLNYDAGYPVLVNDEAMTDLARQAAMQVLETENIGEMAPSMGGEDFAFFLREVPGTFARLGAMAPGTAKPYGLHTTRMMIDEECIAVGVAYYLSVVQQFLGQNRAQ